MRSATPFLAGLAATLLAAPAAPAADVPLEGKWLIVSVERDGKADPALAGGTRVHEGGKYTITPKDGKPLGGTYTADASKSPGTIEMKPASGRYQGKTLRGIFRLDGETLVIAFPSDPDGPAPADFTAKAGVVVATHKKQN
jgi:uncharacterized protein (TIGR03067 family)